MWALIGRRQAWEEEHPKQLREIEIIKIGQSEYKDRRQEMVLPEMKSKSKSKKGSNRHGQQMSLSHQTCRLLVCFLSFFLSLSSLFF